MSSRREVAAPVILGSTRHKGMDRERFSVLAAATLILLTLGLYLRSRPANERAEQNLLPYQTLAQTLPASEQRMFQALHQGLLAAEVRRAVTGDWPDISTLTAAGVVPFVSRPTASQLAYHWRRFAAGYVFEYLGLPAEPAGPAWLVMVQEPTPGSLPDPAPNDEEHHRLPDGTVLHVYVWMHRFGGRVPERLVLQPQAEAWTEVRSAPLATPRS